MIDSLDAIVGDEAHIRSRKPTGSRSDPAYPQVDLDRYENLILLFRAHHKLIDSSFWRRTLPTDTSTGSSCLA